MGPTEINGLPAHVLLVHAVLALVPLASLLLLASAWWPAARRRLGIVTPLVALAALASVPVTTHAGNWLLSRVRVTANVQRHAQLGPTLLPWVIALFVAALLTWIVYRLLERRPADRDGSRPRSTAAVSIALGLIAVVVSAGTLITIYRIGDSGARAAWTGNFSTRPGVPPPAR